MNTDTEKRKMKTSDRIAKICEYSKIESYLEIGVESGLTFNEVKKWLG